MAMAALGSIAATARLPTPARCPLILVDTAPCPKPRAPLGCRAMRMVCSCADALQSPQTASERPLESGGLSEQPEHPQQRKACDPEPVLGAEALIAGFFQGKSIGKSIGKPGFVPVKMKWLLQDPIDSNGIRFVGTSLHL